VPRPAFKIHWSTPRNRVLGGIVVLEEGPSPRPAEAGAGREYSVRFVPHLAPGTYRLQAALQSWSGGETVVIDGRPDALVCAVPAWCRPSGPGLLEGCATLLTVEDAV
jgi:hypothetical protein